EPEEEVQDQKLLEREPQWQLHEDGLLQPLYPVLDFYQVVEAQCFCEVDQGTSWYKITAASIRQAIKQGFGIDTIIHFLQVSCAEGIPGSLVIRMKLWGGGYNGQDEVHVERNPMIRLPEDICRDLFIDKELRQLLGIEVEQAYRLIRIDPKHLEQVLSLLRE